jgi:hypothetical protein
MSIALSLLPVVAFLASLYAMDSFRLLRWRTLAACMGAGCLAAAVSMWINEGLAGAAGGGRGAYWSVGLPLVEEAAKAAFVAYLIATHRVGFMVDAAICGFGIGTGFALVENVYFLRMLESDNLLLWGVRGFGTAMMHGAATALVGIIAMRASGEAERLRPSALAPGVAAAAAIHMFYNSGFLTPVAAALVILIGLPILVTVVFIHSENALRAWVNEKLDKDIGLLAMLATGEFMESNAGKYLKGLRSTFAPEVVGDMLCYLQINVELSVQSKGELMRKEVGLPPAADPELEAKLKELSFLERSIGRSGMRALAPLLPRSARDLWELHALAAKQSAER